MAIRGRIVVYMLRAHRMGPCASFHVVASRGITQACPTLAVQSTGEKLRQYACLGPQRVATFCLFQSAGSNPAASIEVGKLLHGQHVVLFSFISCCECTMDEPRTALPTSASCRALQPSFSITQVLKKPFPRERMSSSQKLDHAGPYLRGCRHLVLLLLLKRLVEDPDKICFQETFHLACMHEGATCFRPMLPKRCRPASVQKFWCQCLEKPRGQQSRQNRAQCGFNAVWGICGLRSFSCVAQTPAFMPPVST